MGTDDSSQQDPEAIKAYVRIKLNDISVTMAHPVSSLSHVYQPPTPSAATSFPTGTLPTKVPVVRIFGTTPRNQSVCLNVHGIWPYFFVEYPPGRSLAPESVHRYTHRLAIALNSALCQSLRQDPYAANSKTGAGGVNTSTLHVSSVLLCKGIPFYGYHVGYSYFLRISLVTPSHIYRAVNLLEGGSVMKNKFAVYESHLATKLQFMVDFDLYGCGWVDVERAMFRQPLPPGDPYSADREGIFNDLTVDPSMLHPATVGKDTWSQLEIDIVPWQILNRRRLRPRYLHDSLKELLFPEMFDPEEKYVRSVRELWKEESRRRVEMNLPAEEGMVPATDERIQRSVPSQGDVGFKGGVWDSTEMWEQKLDERIRAEDGERKRNWELRNIGRPLPAALDPTAAGIWDKWIPTTFQVVETGWPREMTSSRRTRSRGKRATQSSPLKARDPTQRPTLYEDEDEEEQADDVDLEEENPFTQLAASQKLPAVKHAEQEGAEVEEEVDDLDEDTVELIGTQSAKKWHESEERVEAEMQGFREMMDVTPSKPGSRQVEADPDLGDQEEMLDDDFVGHLTQMQSRRKTQANVLDSPATASRRVRGEAITPEPEPPTRKGNNPYYVDSLPSTPSSSRHSTPRKNLFGRQRMATPSPPRQPFAMGPKRTPGISLSGPSPFKSPSKPVTPSRLRFVSTGQPLTMDEEDDVFIASTARDKLVAAVRFGEAVASKPGSKSDNGSVEDRQNSDIQGDLNKADEEVAPLAQMPRRSPSLSPPASLPRPSLISPALTPRATPRKHPAMSILKRPRRELSDDDDGISQLEPTYKATQAKRARFAAESSSEEEGMMEPTYVSQSATRSVTGNLIPETDQSLRSTHPIQNSAERSDLDMRDSGVALDASQTSVSASTESHESSELLAINTFCYAPHPPSRSHVEATIRSFGEVDIIYQKPFFSAPQDLPSTKSTYGTRTFQLRTNGIETLSTFTFGRETSRPQLRHLSYKKSEVRGIETWMYRAVPPSRSDTARWLVEEEQLRLNDASHDTRQKLASQLGEPTQLKFRYSDRKKGSNAQRESQSLTCLSLDVFAPSRGRLLPDPKQDPIAAVFYCLQDSKATLNQPISEHGYYTGIWMVESEKNKFSRLGNLHGLFVEYFESELDLFNEIVDRVRSWDPDVLAGWEVHGSSWGYLAGRASEEFGMNLSDEFSRVRASTSAGGHSSWNVTQNSAFKVVGRHVFNIWRIMRGDLNLLGYTFENVAYHLLKQRFPRYSTSSLTSWYNSQYPTHVIKVLQYYVNKTSMYMEMMDAAEICTKNAEFARVFGVDFNSAMTRGSQFKVESFMFRIAKPEGFVLISPSREAVGKQNAAECQPLIQEPPSAFYEDPVLVLDFQSLYPSIMIGYNYCYSTCLGRVDPFRGTYKLGWSAQHMPEGQIALLKDHVTISPNGRIYAKQTLRKSLLAKMLREILDTRVMVKQGMKTSKGNKSLLQVLNARQLGLKLMANVTYGYTGASFSGRMPCVEIADDIVQTGRETLEKAIQFIESQHHWGARVIYGDTDSLFVLLEGRTIPQAFRIGNEMAEQITARNPRPIKLKFEKVYTKCVLEAKKRYVGFKMESIDETPSFDAKGIETVRRDGCPAAQKMLENVLKLLFRKADLSEIKRYCIDEWTKILQGKISFQDLIISKEVKLGSYSENGLPPPGAVIAGRRLAEDPMNEAEYGERVPFIITKHGASERLVHKARAPEDLLNDRNILPDTEYYITRQIIPPINRVLKLVGVDAVVWYAQMPRRHLVYDRFRVKDGKGKMGKTLDATWRTAHCLVCGVRCGKDQEVCDECTAPANLASSLHALSSRYHLSTSRLLSIQRACASCASTAVSEHVKCESVDCPVLYARVKAGNEVQDTEGLVGVINKLDKEERKGWTGEEIGPEVISLLDSDDE